MSDVPPALLERLRKRAAEPDLRVDMSPAPELPGPAATADLDKAERSLGFQLPADARVVYETVANGGFGPGYGLVGIAGGATGFAVGGRRWHCEDEYEALRAAPDFDWPERLLPVCDWGCAIYSCIDCSTRDAAVVRAFGDAIADKLPAPIQREGYTFLAWLTAWVDEVDLWEVVTFADAGV